MFGGYEGEKGKKKKRGEENRIGRERKRIEREKKEGRIENGVFADVPTIEPRRSES